ncbi:hypothetical protein [Pediococcus argentinicus]|uniref:Uncharacterized protein n=1 Tax=Pediococcus argentinicus TaxID=480391 RepID=A0A0R2NHH1_9LACO|nr:hypothetical protein [Pediococcus argentinicus]KRO25241.1 hypothetical protein IV88_GL000370 [Pediococcus argentinicus]NKZ22362.1 hypothetical protein [Pediococcus argentinicus]GEP19501.1 hypothetical protein LSA03_08850 [Pediococcus argentinicus]
MTKKDDRQQLYSDSYFEKGHIGLKIWQTFIAILGWFAAIIPVVITVTAFLASYNPKIPHIWSYKDGIFEIKFLGILLLFSFSMAFLFAVSMTLIQNRRRDRLIEQWPTFSPINQKKRGQALEDYMSKRFGDKEFRENTRYYEVAPDQNLDTHVISKLYDDLDINDMD